MSEVTSERSESPVSFLTSLAYAAPTLVLLSLLWRMWRKKMTCSWIGYSAIERKSRARERIEARRSMSESVFSAKCGQGGRVIK
jgi:hypothetical protein